MKATLNVIELKNISKTFGNIHALDQVDFDLREGEIHALVGENGAGKSTLMRILAGIYAEYDGEYLLKNNVVHLHSPKDASARGIGMIHQELSVIPELSVAENLFLGRQLTSPLGIINWRKMNAIAKQELVKLGFGSIDARKPLGSYGLGIQQIVEILRAILSGAEVLIMDEPTTALSPAEVERLLELVKTLRESGRSIIYISHFLDEVLRVADRITVLRDGKKVETVEQANTSMDHLISTILGRQINAVLPKASSKQHEKLLLEVISLSTDVFKDINLVIGEGEIVGLYGAIGAGHFEFARAMYGLYHVDKGTITVSGQRFPRNFSARYAITHGVGYAIESRRRSLFMGEANFRNVSLPHLYRISALFSRPKQELRVAKPALEKVNVQPPGPFNPVGNLSGGNQQKVAIARWLAYPPQVLIVSEPTRGMDVGAKNEVLSILMNFRNEGYGILVASSEPETVLSVADRVVVMSRGRITAEMENKDLDKDILVRLI